MPTVPSATSRLEELITKLRERERRITPQRIAILRVLTSSQGHPSVEQIHEQVKEDFPTTSLATIYKTVALLKDMGEVLELSFRNEGSRYDANRPRPHPHLVCANCGTVSDLEVDGGSDLPQRVAQRTGYTVLSHRLDFFGICPQCHTGKSQ